MGQFQDYPAIIRELLAGIDRGWNEAKLREWLSTNNIQDRDLAQWLRSDGAKLCGETKIRRQLTSLAILGWGDVAQAAGDILQGSKKQKHNSQKYVSLEDLPIDVGDRTEILSDRDRAVKLNPNSFLAWLNRGIALYIFGEYQAAILSFDRAIEIRSDNPSIWWNRSTALFFLGQYIELKADLYQAWFNRGVSLYQLGKYEDTIASYDRVIELKPDFYTAWYNRAIALVDLGKNEEGIASYHRTIEIKSDFYQAWDNLGNL